MNFGMPTLIENNTLIDNTATVWINVNDLLKIINKHGNEIVVVQV